MIYLHEMNIAAQLQDDIGQPVIDNKTLVRPARSRTHTTTLSGLQEVLEHFAPSLYLVYRRWGEIKSLQSSFQQLF